ncbi:MAG: hypothetical protein ACOX7J_01750 [Bacillota bacterium]
MTEERFDKDLGKEENAASFKDVSEKFADAAEENTEDKGGVYEFHTEYADDDQYDEAFDEAYDEAYYGYDDRDDEMYLDKIDEVMRRTKLSFAEAKDCLEAFDYDIVETLAAIDEEFRAEAADIKQRRRQRYNDAKDFGREKYADFKDFGKESFNDIRDRLKGSTVKSELGKMCGKIKDAASTPVEVTKSGKKLPAGILGAGAVSLLYPLHKSKALTALGLGAIGVWAAKKQLDNEETKAGIKAAADSFSQNFADSFNGLTGGKKDDNCFIITVDDDFQPKNLKKE